MKQRLSSPASELWPDADIAGFGDSGIDILAEFGMEGVDDGKNRVGADLMHSIWRSIQEHGMEIPFPQRESCVTTRPPLRADGDYPPSKSGPTSSRSTRIEARISSATWWQRTPTLPSFSSSSMPA